MKRAMPVRSSPEVTIPASTILPLARVCGAPAVATSALQMHFRPAVSSTSPPFET